MRPIPIFVAALFVVACGATAQVTNSPTPALTTAPTTVPTAPTIPPSALATSSPSPLVSSTPIPLSTPTPTGLSTPTPFVSPSTQAPSSSPSSGNFAKLDSFPASDAFEVTDVTATPSGFVAVGYGGLNGADYYGLRQGIVWTSVDGINWTETVDPGLVDVSPSYVVSNGTDLFMAGNLSACSGLDDTCTDVPQAGNGIWRSSNGGAWELLPQLADMQNGYFDDMLWAGDRLVVYGGAGENQTTTVWVSPDGSSWTSTTDLSGMDPVTSMAVSPAGLSAFGTSYDNSLGDVLLVGTASSDGMHFGLTNAPSMQGAGIDDLAAGPAAMVGVGYETTDLFNNNGVAVSSTDGTNWTEATNNDGSFAGSTLQTVHALAAGGFVAVGSGQPDDNTGLSGGIVWFSADGSDWVRIGQLDGAFSLLDASALGATGLVIFADEQVDLPDDSTVGIVHAWFAPLASIHS